MIEVAVVIPYLDGSKFVDKCVESVENQKLSFDVVDVIFKEQDFPNKYGFGNLGFTKCVNNGLRKALNSERKFGYFAIFNDDIELSDDYFMKCIEAFESLTKYRNSPEKIGLVTGKIGSLRPNEEDLISWGGSEPPYPRGIHKKGLISKNELNEMTEERWIPFVACIISRECLLDVGLLDEHFKWVHSDGDFCYRARYNGWKCLYCPEAFVKHWWGGSLNPDNEQLAIECNLDYDRFIDKWINNGRLFSKLDRRS